jgi:hypothetical protein
VEYGIALFNGSGIAANEAAAATVFRKAALKGSAIAQDRLARILAAGRGAPANPVEAVKWHLVSKAGGETDLLLDDFVQKLDAPTREAGEKAAKPWIDAITNARRTATAGTAPPAPAIAPSALAAPQTSASSPAPPAAPGAAAATPAAAAKPQASGKR